VYWLPTAVLTVPTRRSDDSAHGANTTCCVRAQRRRCLFKVSLDEDALASADHVEVGLVPHALPEGDCAGGGGGTPRGGRAEAGGGGRASGGPPPPPPAPPPPPPPPPPQRCIARSITQRPALHRPEHSEPTQARSQHANQAYTSGGIFQSAFNGCCAQTIRVRVSLANSRTRALLFSAVA